MVSKKAMNIERKKKTNAVLYGVLAGTGILLFYVAVLTAFQSFEFAIVSLQSLWYLIVPLAAGFGMQIGLYSSIKHDALINTEVAVSGGVSGGSMAACCSHFLFNLIPFAGAAAFATVLMRYQKWFLGIGILSNVVGIGFLIHHKRKMKGGIC
jgi:Cu+-exporting ATPase